MSFYSEIAKDIPWEITSNTDGYLKVVGGKLQLPNPKWLAFHLRYLDNVIEAIHAFKAGKLAENAFDVDTVKKIIIDDPEEGIRELHRVAAEYKEFAIDIESSNLSTDKTQNRILTIGIAYKIDEGISFMKECFESEEFRREFQEFCLNPDLCFILHNGVFDRSRTRIIANIELKIDDDTLLMHYAGINEHKGTHGLKDLAQLYLGFPEWDKPLDDWKKAYCRSHKIKNADFQYDYFPQRMLAEYNVIDCCATFGLKQAFKPLMRESSIYIYRKLIEAAPCYADIISRGMKLNVAYWEELKEKLEAQEVELRTAFEKEAPGIKITSPVKLKAWLQKRFPFELIEKADKNVIEDLTGKYPEDKTLAVISDYRKISKYLKTYVYGLWKRKDYEGIIHCEFNLHGTETGRLSSKNPNMQNIPRNSLIKSLFIAREGYTLLQLDYSQAELRTLAHISGDPTLTDCYINGRDLHAEMGQKIFGDKFDPHNKDQRMAAKIVNFGIPYGRTPGGVSRQLKISLSEAKDYLAKWFEGAPKVKDYIAQCHKMALSDPQDVYYTVFGRARHYFVTNENEHHVKNQSVNFPISSTANDLTIHAMVEICKWLKENKIDAYPVNTVHDSIIVEVRPADAQKVAEKCLEIMSAIPKKYLKDLKVPFVADAEVGDCYGDMSEPEWTVVPDDEEEDEDVGDSN